MEVTVEGSSGVLLTPADVAAQLGVPVKSIYVWRTKGTAPRGIRVGKHLRFRQSDVDAWIEAQADKRESA
jgi:excisionase family DNA binding protein